MKRKSTIICFGEVLWDVFPEGSKIGGAPLNVAYHLNKLGLNSLIISRVGEDDNGQKLLNQIDSWGISTANCQVDKRHPTSRVLAKVAADGDTTYEILAPVAWDFIAWNPEVAELVLGADALVFGSLAARMPTTRETLLRLIKTAKYKVFDVNLRAPHYSKEGIFELLAHVDLLKINHEELEILVHWLDPQVREERRQIDLLFQKFPVSEILVSKGAEGATHYTEGSTLDCPAYSIEVINTVGSGDAFLAGFLSQKWGARGSKVEDQLQKAALMGAFVATKDRACPDYDEQMLKEFKKQQN